MRLSIFSICCLATISILAGSATGASKKSAALEKLKPELLEEADLLKRAIQGNDVPGAIGSVQLIDAWLRQVQAQNVTDVFIDIPGWEKELGESQAIGQVVFGGATTASCTYRKGDKEVTIDIVGNSPMLSMISGMMGMAIMSGKQVIKINGNKALVDKDGNGVEVQVPFQGTALVTGRGPEQESTVHVMKKGVNWDGLAEATRN